MSVPDIAGSITAYVNSGHRIANAGCNAHQPTCEYVFCHCRTSHKTRAKADTRMRIGYAGTGHRVCRAGSLPDSTYLA
eukprot:1602105-Rhodomonas_salina.1